jgi:hypothetical protein
MKCIFTPHSPKERFLLSFPPLWVEGQKKVIWGKWKSGSLYKKMGQEVEK